MRFWNSLLVVTFVTLVFVCSCQSKQTNNNQLKDFVGSQFVLLTDSMINFKTEASIKKTNKYTYVVFVDSIDCSECAINSMTLWADDLDMMDALESGVLDYAFIFSPRNCAKKRIVNKIKEDCVFPEYTYVDTAEVTLRHNPNIPRNRAMHTFLVDNYRNVVIVGSPIYNNQVKQLFKKIMGQSDIK